MKDLFDLEEVFLHRMKRKIYNDRTFSLEGILYEAPAHLVGKQVEIRFNPQDKSQVKVYFQGKLEQVAIPTKAYENCFVKRDDDSKELRSSTSPLKVKRLVLSIANGSGINYVELVHQNYYQNQPRHVLSLAEGKEEKDDV